MLAEISAYVASGQGLIGTPFKVERQTWGLAPGFGCLVADSRKAERQRRDLL